jgi:hypothetical protein
MIILAKMLILALVAMPCYSEKRQNSKRSVTIYIDLRANVPLETLAHAQMLASVMFIKTGVYLNWRMGLPKSHDMKGAIAVDITSITPSTFHPGALAYAEAYAKQLNGVHVRVFFDRVENSGKGKLVPVLLAHVLVHEITHILQGSDHHSAEGVMKARWTANDLYQMLDRPLPFDPFDVDLIQRGLASRGRPAISAHLGKDSVAKAVATQ